MISTSYTSSASSAARLWVTEEDGIAKITVSSHEGQDLLTISVSEILVTLLAAPSSSLGPEFAIGLAGEVFLFGDASINGPRTLETPLDDLVARAVGPDMLADEPEVQSSLAIFSQRLVKALQSVDHAIIAVAEGKT